MEASVVDSTKLQEAEREAAFYREAALTVPSGAHIGKAIDTAVVAERTRLAANDGDNAFYDDGVCSVCLASRSDGVHRDGCPVVALRAALQQAWDENDALTRDLAASETAKREAEADVGKILAWLRSRDAYSDACKEWVAAKRAEGDEVNVMAIELRKYRRFVLDIVADHVEKMLGEERASDG